MSQNGFRIKNSANLFPQAGSVVTTSGDIAFRNDTQNYEVYGTSTVQNLLTDTNTLTVSNKSISASSNTLSGITNTNLSGTAAISNANLAAMATLTIKGNNTGGSATPSDLTVAQVNAILPVFTSTLNGLAPLSGGGSVNYLRADGTWSAPPGTTGTVTSVAMTVPSFLSVSGSPITTSGTLAVSLSGTALPIANGGTGATTAAGAFNALSPITSTGDLIIGTGTNTASRLAIGGNNTVLTSNGTTASWQAAGTASPLTTKGDLYGYSTTNARIPVGTDYQTIIADANQTLGVRYSSQYKGPKNYITYSDFENNATTGWSLGTVGTLTNGIPTGTPTFGSGASGNLSISTVSSGQLAGLYSLSYASSAATTAGNMLATQSYAIDAEDQAKVLTFKFYYSVPSGASNCNFSGTSNNSFGLAVYDVTNSSWLSSTANFGMTQSSGSGYVTGTCQTNINTANLRFVLYNANATSGAATLYLDDFFLGPQTAPLGAVVTDWQSYTVTFTAGPPSTTPVPGTNTTLAKWRRVGDTMEIYYNFAQTAAGTAGAGAYLINIPPGYTIDSTKVTVSAGLSSATAVGPAQLYDPNVNPNDQFGNVVPYDTSHLTLNLNDNVTTGASSVGWNNGNGSLANATVNVSFTAIVPIVGWSSNVQMSSDTDTRVVALRAYSSTGSSMGTMSGTASTVIYNTVANDTHGAYNSANGIYTVPVTGYYDFAGQIFYAATAAPISNVLLSLYNITASVVVGSHQYDITTSSATSYTTPFSIKSVYLAAGSQVAIQSSYAGSYTSNPTYTTSSTINFLSISRQSGPSVIAATESVNASYNSSASQSVGTSFAAFTYSNKLWDSHNQYNTTTGTYTIPVSGKYRISAMASINVTSLSTAQAAQLQVVQAGGTSLTKVIGLINGDGLASAVSYTPTGSATFNCIAGDTLTIQATSGVAGTEANGANYNHFEIERVGN